MTDMMWKKFSEEKPKPGQRFVAMYSDGSGARAFLMTSSGDAWEAEDTEIEAGFEGEEIWIPLPPDYKLSFMRDDKYDWEAEDSKT